MPQNYERRIPVELTEIDYTLYGILYNLSGEGENTGNTNLSVGSDYIDVDTSVPVVDAKVMLGYTRAKKIPYVLAEMERHSHTQEAQVPTDQPIVFCVADTKGDCPKAEDVFPVILRPGYVFVLHRDVWHSSSHGLLHDGGYYWMAEVYNGEPTIWRDVEGGPLQIG